MKYYVTAVYYDDNLKKFSVNAVSIGHALTKANKLLLGHRIKKTMITYQLSDNDTNIYPLIRIK